MKGYEEPKMEVLEIEANVVVQVSTLEGVEFGDGTFAG